MASQYHKLPFDQMAKNFTPSQAAASNYDGQTSQADGASVYSYQSDDIRRFLKEVDGRTFNAQSDVYFLPSDEKEFDRLHKQHYALVLAFGGLCPCPDLLEETLKDDGSPKTVLDLGCGSGIWAVEIAQRFPHVSVLGVDLAPVPMEASRIPENCRFEIDDVNDELTHLSAQYDVVHSRFISAGIQHPENYLQSLVECLKPGGLAILVDGDLTLYSEDSPVPIPQGTEENPEGSWLARFIWEGKASTIRRLPPGVRELRDCVEKGLWSHPLIDPETCATCSVNLPMGPFIEGNTEEDQRLRYCGSLIRQDFLGVIQSWQPLLAREGIPKELIDDWSTKAEQDLKKMKHRQSVRMVTAWGRRNGGPSRTKPSYSEPKRSTTGYQLLRFYTTQEEADKSVELRQKLAKDLPIQYLLQSKT